MADRRASSSAAAAAFGGPLAFALLVLLAVGALGVSMATARDPWRPVPRGPVDDLLGPARAAVGAPFAATRAFAGAIGEHWGAVEENRRLREENARLLQWYELAQSMRDRMERYDRLLALNPDPGVDVVAARVVADFDGPFVKARLLNAGATHGVAPGYAVLAERGLVGRIVAVGERSARVLLLGDINSRVPVMVERHDARAILSGDNTDAPRLDFLPVGHGVATGDRIVTSGDGGELPRGLPVGEAFADGSGAWRVRLFAEEAAFDYVRVVRFAFPETPEVPVGFAPGLRPEADDLATEAPPAAGEGAP
jgi:rod shape-determining protein MreC